MKRRRVSSDGEAPPPLCAASSSLPPCGEPKAESQEALTSASTSDTETRDSSSLIDPGTEQDPPTPDPGPASSGNLDSSPKEKMEASSSSSLLQEAGEEREPPHLEEEEGRSASSDELKEAPPLSEEAAFPSGLVLAGEGPSSPQVFPSGGPQPDTLDMLYRTVEATIAIVTKLSTKGPPSS